MFFIFYSTDITAPNIAEPTIAISMIQITTLVILAKVLVFFFSKKITPRLPVKCDV